MWLRIEDVSVDSLLSLSFEVSFSFHSVSSSADSVVELSLRVDLLEESSDWESCSSSARRADNRACKWSSSVLGAKGLFENTSGEDGCGALGYVFRSRCRIGVALLSGLFANSVMDFCEFVDEVFGSVRFFVFCGMV